MKYPNISSYYFLINIVFLIFIQSIYLKLFSFNNRLGIAIHSFVNAIFTYALLFMHIVSEFGFKSWNSGVTIQLMKSYVGKFDFLIESIGLKPFIFYVTSIVFILLTSFFYYLLLQNRQVMNTFKNYSTSIFKKKIKILDLFIFAFILQYIFLNNLWLHREFFHKFFSNRYENIAPEGLFYHRLDEGVYDYSKFTAKSESNYDHVFLITVDSLRYDMIGTEYTGFINNLLKKEDVYFSKAYSSCTSTFCSLLSLISSSHYDNLNKKLLTLTDILKINNYQTNFIFSGDHTEFAGFRYFLGLEKNIDNFYDGSNDIDPNDDYEIFKNFEKINFDKNSFTFIHFMSPHMIGKKYNEYMIHDVSSTGALSDFKNRLQSYVKSYQNGVNQFDHLLKMLFDRLQEKEVLQNSLIIITSDHGEFLGEYDLTGHAKPPLEEITAVPIIILNAKSSITDRKLISLVDISPTILDLLSIAIPKIWDGTSLTKAVSDHSIILKNSGVELQKVYDSFEKKITSNLKIKNNECLLEEVFKYDDIKKCKK